MCPGWGRAPSRQEGRVWGRTCSPHEGQPFLGRSRAPWGPGHGQDQGWGTAALQDHRPSLGSLPPPRPGCLPWPTVGAMVPFHRPRMLRLGVQDLPGPGWTQRCPPCWGAVFGPWHFWVNHLLALQSQRHRDSRPWSGSARCWGSNLCDEGGRDSSHPPSPRGLLEHPRPHQGRGTSPMSALWDPPGALRVRGRECAQIKPSPTAPAEESRDPGPRP